MLGHIQCRTKDRSDRWLQRQNSLDRIKETKSFRWKIVLLDDRLQGDGRMDISPSLSLRPICHPVMPKVFPAELTWTHGLLSLLSEDVTTRIHKSQDRTVRVFSHMPGSFAKWMWPAGESWQVLAGRLFNFDSAKKPFLLVGKTATGRIEDHVLVNLLAAVR